MKVLLVTGSYPPDKCGVGDYCHHLARALSKVDNLEVAVLTNLSKIGNEVVSGVKVFRRMPCWKNFCLFEIKRVITEFQPDVVHIQYPTQGYRGNPPSLMPLYFRYLGIPVVQTWHEYFYQSGVRWHNLLGCSALIYVRPDFSQKIPSWVKKALSKTPQFYIANTSTIPNVELSDGDKSKIKDSLSGGKRIVCFFGFAHVNKGMELLFDIVDPSEYHLVLICDLNKSDEYHAKILSLASQEPWRGNVSITGFLTAEQVGEILSIADAVVFPFPSGAGEWNTSLNASQASGSFSLATTQNLSLLGYQEKTNTYFTKCGDLVELKNALRKYSGRRNKPKKNYFWSDIATAHINIYKKLVNKNNGN